jgi:hypothetical protein
MGRPTTEANNFARSVQLRTVNRLIRESQNVGIHLLRRTPVSFHEEATFLLSSERVNDVLTLVARAPFIDLARLLLQAIRELQPSSDTGASNSSVPASHLQFEANVGAVSE